MNRTQVAVKLWGIIGVSIFRCSCFRTLSFVGSKAIAEVFSRIDHKFDLMCLAFDVVAVAKTVLASIRNLNTFRSLHFFQFE